MKTFIGILLVGFLGFLGCSGSDNDGTSTAIGAATPVAPFGIIDTPTPTYEWTPVPGATMYRLVVQDTNGTYIIDEWNTAEEAGCASEDGLCAVTPDIDVIGKNEFKVQTCANEECGGWSEPLNFDFTAMDVPRFTDHGDGTVTDNRTGLIWDINANRHGAVTGEKAGTVCIEYEQGHREWSEPGIAQLRSLIDKGQFDPALTPGNPFINVQYGGTPYWSISDPVHHPPGGGWWVVSFDDGGVGYVGPRQTGKAWLWCMCRRFCHPDSP